MARTEFFSPDQLEAIAGALGDTDAGLTNAEIDFLIDSCEMKNPGPMTKRLRIYNAFAEAQNRSKDRTLVLGFIRKALKPARYVRQPERFEPMRTNVNRALAFAGLFVDEKGELQRGQRARTLPDADRRARDLRVDLEQRDVHPDVLMFCRAELLVDDYFHAVQEAVKSVAVKLQSRTGLIDDGGALVDRALGGESPLLAINKRDSVSAKSEQTGFANLVKGTFGMFRNPTAHAARLHWSMTKEDAEDLLTIVSMIHRRLDTAYIPSRT